MSRKLTYDTYLFGAAMLIVVVGMVMIYSASAIITMQKVGSDNPYYFITRQFVWLIAGGAVMVMLMHLDPARLRDRRIIYAVRRRGARRAGHRAVPVADQRHASLDRAAALPTAAERIRQAGAHPLPRLVPGAAKRSASTN